MEEEYKMLREEIMQKIELHNSLLTFTITTSVVILTFALSQNNAMIYLIPFVVIVPMSLRICYYLSAMVKLSAYMIVFLESNNAHNWETRNKQFVKNRLNEKKTRLFDFTTQRYYEFLILSLTCYILYFSSYIQNFYFNFWEVFNLIWPLSFVIFEIIMTKYLNSTGDKREKMVQEWEDVKNSIHSNENTSNIN